VNHQIQNDVHIGPSLKKRMQAVNFNKNRSGNDFFKSHDGRVEPFDKSNLYHQLVFAGQREQFIRFFKCGTHGFFDQNVNARRQKIFGHFVMLACGHGNADSVNLTQHLLVICVCGTGIKLRCLLRPFGNGIRHGDNFTIIDIAIFLKMIISQVADADHADS
jgi:hypothetical protein